MGIFKSILTLITYILTGGIFLVFIIPISIVFLPGKKHKKVFSSMLFRYMKWAINTLLPFLRVLKVSELSGEDKIGKAGIIISNHRSCLDGFLVMGNFPSVPLIKSIYKFNPLFAWIAAFFDFVMLKFLPSELIKAEEELCKRLKNGEKIYICPEGTRSADGKIGKFHPLAFKIAINMNAPVFPVVIKYSKPIMGKDGRSWIFGKKVEVKIKVLDEMLPLRGENTAKFMQRVQCAVESCFEAM